MNDLANPHKPGTKAAARWDRRQAALKEFAEARERRREAEQMAKPPAGLGDWGLMRTRAWVAQQKKLAQLLKSRKGAPPLRPRSDGGSAGGCERRPRAGSVCAAGAGWRA